MEQLIQRTYTCGACGTCVQIRDDLRPVEMIQGQSGGPNVQVVTVAAEEVHRCELVEPNRTISL